MADIRTDAFTAECESATVTRVFRRRLEQVIDEPEVRGGTNTAMSPTEVFMVSLAGCVNVVLSNVARRMHVDLSVGQIELECDSDTLDVRGLTEIGRRFQKFVCRSLSKAMNHGLT